MTAELSGLPSARRDDGRRFVVRVDEKLTAFIELEAAIRGAFSGIVRAQITHGSEPSVVTGNILHKNRAPPD